MNMPFKYDWTKGAPGQPSTVPVQDVQIVPPNS